MIVVQTGYLNLWQACAMSNSRIMRSPSDIIHEEITKTPSPRWDKTFLDYTVPLPPAPPALIKINGVDVCFRNGITAISGADKAGKSTLVRVFLAAILSGQTILNVDATRDIKVLHIDTEQPTDRVIRLVDNSFRLAKLERAERDNYTVCALRIYTPEVRLQIVEETIEDLHPDLVIIDGITDLIPDINDLSRSSDLVAKVLTIIDTFQCGLIALIHTNPSDSAGKLRGHLGSEIMRKCETSILVERSDAGVFSVKCKASRGRPFDAFSFMKNGQDDLVPIDVPIKPTNSTDKMLEVIEPNRDYTHTELVKLAMDRGVSEASAKRAITKLFQKGWIEKSGKSYHLRHETENSDLKKVSSDSII